MIQRQDAADLRLDLRGRYVAGRVDVQNAVRVLGQPDGDLVLQVVGHERHPQFGAVGYWPSGVRAEAERHRGTQVEHGVIVKLVIGSLPPAAGSAARYAAVRGRRRRRTWR